MFFRLYQYQRVFSLDIVIGACISCLFIGKLLEVDLPPAVIICLAIAVWLIYTTDHLLDGLTISKIPLTLRHSIHQKYSVIILEAALLISLIGIFFAIQLPPTTLKWGGLLIVWVAFYFSLLTWIKPKKLYIKEVLGAAIYSFGIFLGPLSIYPGHFDLRIGLILVEFFMIVLVNLLIFAKIDQEVDLRNNFPSLIKTIGRAKMDRLIRLIWVLLVSILLVSSFVYLQDGFFLKIQLLLGIMGVSLFLVESKGEFFKQKGVYPFIGDAVFLFPVVFLI